MAVFGIPWVPTAINIEILNKAIRAIVGISLVAEIDIFTYVTQRTSQDLYLANKEAQLALKLKDAFLATMSREIRTPMNVTVGMIEVMEIMPHSEEQKRSVGTFRASSFSLLSIIDITLDETKCTEGNFILRYKNE